MTQNDFEIFMMAPPGLEQSLLAEIVEQGFAQAEAVPGGVTCRGGWPDVWRANLNMRGAGRVLARIGEFRAFHLAQLDKRSRKFPWGDVLRSDVPIRVEVTCRKSKIYHAGAAAQRIETALREELGAEIRDDATIQLKARIDDNLVTFSVDTSGEALHKRGHKPAVGKAPMRETMAALFLRECGYTGNEPVVDPMCGSGTFPIEAAEWAMGLAPGRSRAFAFGQLATFDAQLWDQMRNQQPTPTTTDLIFRGSDRDTGAITRSATNAERSGVQDITLFQANAISDLQRPDGPPGLLIVNPPYGGRIGNKNLLYALYGTFGQVVRDRFKGWRIGMITTDTGLARATKLPFLPVGAPIAHGGLKVRLFRTKPL